MINDYFNPKLIKKPIPDPTPLEFISVCDASYRKAYREANKEKIKAYRKAYYEANKEKKKAYREANKEKKKAYREANKEKINDQRN